MAARKHYIEISLIPKPCWGYGPRKILESTQFIDLYAKTLQATNNKCEICGNIGSIEHPIECDEIWSHNLVGVSLISRRLIRMMPVCWLCNLARHPGRAIEMAKLNPARLYQYIECTNGWKPGEAKMVLRKAFRQWRDQNNYAFQIDLTYLQKIGYVDTDCELIFQVNSL